MGARAWGAEAAAGLLWWMGLAGGAACQPEGDCTSRAWYADADGDRWGDPGREAVVACEAPAADFVDVAGDCDDRDPAVHPGAEELCDGAPDNDCDRDEDPAEVDGDRDGQSGCDGDCDDGDPAVYPGNAEVCDGADNDCDGAPGDDEVDGDQDGQSACGGDCDDADPANLGGGTEVCDGADNDCDGEADEGLVGQAWSADADGDGHGDPGVTVTPCAAPGKGYVLDATDCDDSDPDVHPGAPDACDGVADNDCDGAADPSEADTDGDGVSVCAGDCDDADPGRFPGNVESCDGDDDDCDGNADEDVVFQTYHLDADGDSYGDAGIGASTCDGPPVGHVPDSTDCDDADPTAYPGAPDVCDGAPDNDCDGVPDPTEADADGDAASVCDGDCDDADPLLHPAAAEVCDGADQDCDGVADEGLAFTVYHPDIDGDSYGDAGIDASTCDGPPEGHVPDATDCDDADLATHPGAPDVCDGALDNDCDGGADPSEADADGDGVSTCDGDCQDGDAGISPAHAETCDGEDEDCDGVADDGLDSTVYHRDADGDTYGDAADAVETCDGAPGGYIADATDCDDADPAIHPGAEEICDGDDEDCDGEVDEGHDADGDGATTCGGDCDDADASVGPGEAEICFNGVDDDCDGLPALGCRLEGADVVTAFAEAKLSGLDSDHVAGAAFAGGDLDGDGVDSLLIGAYGNDEGGTSAGAVFVEEEPAGEWLPDWSGRLLGEEAGDLAGFAVASGEDVDGDGGEDLLVGGYEHASTGAAWLVTGGVSGTVDLSAATAKLSGEAAGDGAGYAVLLAEDLSGDGEPDLVVGAPGHDGGGDDAGAVYVVFGPVAGAIHLAAADAKWVGEDDGDLAGRALAVADLDGDGQQDLLVGAPGDDDGGDGAGAVYGVLGPLSGTLDLSAASVKWTGAGAGDGLGDRWRVSAGDLSGDGDDDVALGASHSAAAGADAGAVWVFHGPFAAGLNDLSMGSDALLLGASPGDRAGDVVVAGGDVDGDGSGDLLVGAFQSGGLGAPGFETSGSAYLLYGPLGGTASLSDADLQLTGEDGADWLGRYLAFADVDGDGLDDLLVGAEGATASGSVYVVPSAPL